MVLDYILRIFLFCSYFPMVHMFRSSTPFLSTKNVASPNSLMLMVSSSAKWDDGRGGGFEKIQNAFRQVPPNGDPFAAPPPKAEIEEEEENCTNDLCVLNFDETPVKESRLRQGFSQGQLDDLRKEFLIHKIHMENRHDKLEASKEGEREQRKNRRRLERR
eukprot:CAMPEP_0194409876 /NCGR_PEP_ID=MMETSP0176-20130528/7816_1 /TAXON_ID=216777 /ORGANISM="Proboscia alata, Strain PI-D3" /LENGTH=160 /DNA_ID=CAMNT_0039210787 /DNA_START=61 /DNA_END=543 /DNA_ORIENTATION=-